MLYLIVGKNSYVAEQELAKVTQHASVPVEHIDTQQLDAAGLAELVRGVSLFAAQRLIVLRRLSERPDLWEQLGQWAHNIPDETTLVLVEPGLDKRTKTYKALHKAATIITADPLTDRQRPAAERWLRQLASRRGVSLSPAQLRSMVERALVPDEKGYGGTIDQLQLAHAIDALAQLETVTDDVIATVLPPAREFSVFDVVTLAVERRGPALRAALDELRLSHDPYQTAALIWVQWTQLAAIACYGEAGEAEIARELSLHPYVVKKTKPLTTQVVPADIRTLTQRAAQLDADMKTTGIPPWDAVESFLFAVAGR